MDNMLLGSALGFLGALLVVGGFIWRSRTVPDSQLPQTYVSIDGIRAVGELVVLKVFTQQIITKTDHLFGDWGEKWMTWLVSAKKTAMIFEFVVDFRYDLRSPLFTPEIRNGSTVHFTMPPCFYDIQLKDISIYDEKASALAPLLLPEWLGQVLGGKFTEKQKNQLIRGARNKAEAMAHQLSSRIMGEVRHSAESTLRSICRGMGYTDATFTFREETQVQGTIDISRFEESVTGALAESDAHNTSLQ